MSVAALVMAVALAGCRRAEPVAAPTAAEAAQLDNAEAELNALGNDEGPTSGDAGPSGNVH